MMMVIGDDRRCRNLRGSRRGGGAGDEGLQVVVMVVIMVMLMAMNLTRAPPLSYVGVDLPLSVSIPMTVQ